MNSKCVLVFVIVVLALCLAVPVLCQESRSNASQQVKQSPAVEHMTEANQPITNILSSASYLTFESGFESELNSIEKETAPKAWTPTERKVIEAAFESVLEKHPGFVNGIGFAGKVRLFRVGNLRKFATAKNSKVYAVTTPVGILLSDLFFEKPSILQRSYFVHELVHWADMGNLVSYSSYWCDFHRDFNLTNGKDLGEALADYTAEFVLRDSPLDIETEVFRSRILEPYFLTPDQMHDSYKKSFLNGILAFKNKRYDLSVKFFEISIRTISSAPAPYINLTMTYSKRGDNTAALKTSGEAIRCFKRSRVPFSDLSVPPMYFTRAVLLGMVAKNYEEATRVVDELLDHCPTHEGAIHLKHFYDKKLAQ